MRQRPRSLLTLACTLALLGCSPTDVELLKAPVRDGGEPDAGAAGPLIPGLRALRVTPERVQLLDDGQDPGESAELHAIGSFVDGDRDVSDEVAWSLQRAELGSVHDGTLTSAGVAGTGEIVVRASGLRASAQLEVDLDARIVLPDAPAGADALFSDDRGADVSGEQAPHILYPSDQTYLPRNLAHVLHQWQAPEALDLFELRFDGALAHVRFYTTARSFEPDAAAYSRLAASAAGEPLVMTVRGLSQAAHATVYASPQVALRFSREPVLGAVYYWSTANEGVMRAHISAPSASKFYTDPTGPDAPKCVGCHTVSRDGRRLAVGYDGEHLRMVSIPDRTLLLPRDPAAPQPPLMMPDPMMMPAPMPDPMMMMPKPPKDPMMDKMAMGPDYGWGTFNPGGTRLLYADKGKLSLLDIESGMVLQDIKLPDDTRATHPDWSPDGRYVAVSYGASDKGDKNKEVIGSSLARIPVQDDGMLGEPEVLLASEAPDDTLFFPVYSPDSQWLAFARATGKSKDNMTTELFLLRADGSGGPIALPRLNRAVRDVLDVTGIGNTMPNWAPTASSEVFWLAFSSLRDYGEQLVGTARDQLWASAIDPSKVASGEDPSYAAFWLPFQDPAESNHRVFWALAGEDECVPTAELCDGIDNDCNGQVDDDCCTPSLEQCGNDKDDDCDGMRDEGCGCARDDTCGNGIDDDCDLNTDEDCDPF